MRKITDEAIRAFEGNKNFKQVIADCTGTYLYLWGNNIARKCDNRLQINLCGSDFLQLDLLGSVQTSLLAGLTYKEQVLPLNFSFTIH